MSTHQERYQTEQARLNLAIRLLRHEARTHIITLCTGLSQDRIRKLWSRYFRGNPQARIQVRRHRGKSPSSVEFFLRNLLVQAEATLLAHGFAHWGLLEIQPDLSIQPVSFEQALTQGERFCDAFEEFRIIVPASDLQFEQAWNLLAALTQRQDLVLLDCRECHTFYIQDVLALDRRRCPACRLVPEQPRRRPKQGAQGRVE